MVDALDLAIAANHRLIAIGERATSLLGSGEELRFAIAWPGMQPAEVWRSSLAAMGWEV